MSQRHSRIILEPWKPWLGFWGIHLSWSFWPYKLMTTQVNVIIWCVKKVERYVMMMMGMTKLSALLTDVEANLDDLFSPGPQSRGALGEAPFPWTLGSFRSFPTSLLDVFSVLSCGNQLWELTWDAFCSWCFLNNLQYRSPKKYFFDVSGTIYIYKRKSLQYFTWDCADNDQFLFFF